MTRAIGLPRKPSALGACQSEEFTLVDVNKDGAMSPPVSPTGDLIVPPVKPFKRATSTNSVKSEREDDRPPPPGLAPITSQGQKFFGGEKDYYKLKEVLGEGSYGSVYRCQRVADSKICAVKVIDPRRLGFVGGEDGVCAVEAMASREVDALRQLAAHPGIISLEGAFYSSATRQIFIVTEFVAGSHLFSHIVQRSESFSEPESAFILAQLTDALSFCHALGVVHRDLKLENVLVARSDVRISDRDKDECDEFFSVKVCDFGFAKALKGYTTATPVGTANYTAPEVEEGAMQVGGTPFVNLTQNLDKDGNSESKYNAFKADVFSLGVMTFVILCHSYPAKDGGEGAHRLHKCWPSLSDNCQSFVDGLLATDPSKRFDMVQAHTHTWLRIAPHIHESGETGTTSFEVDEKTRTHRRSQTHGQPPPELKGILAMQRTFVMMQQERAMACWALAGAPGVGGVSCWDQLRSHVQLTDRRMGDAKTLLQSCASDPVLTLPQLICDLAKARNLAFGIVEEGADHAVASFDHVFLAYNHAIVAMIEIVAKSLEAVEPGSPEVRRAARRYRLFSTAVEQLGRERSFICGHGQQDWGSPKSRIKSVRNPNGSGRGFEPEKLRRLGEILGARKVLLGTVVANGSQMSGDIVATSTGLIGTLIGEGEASLLSHSEIAALESFEERIIVSADEESPPTEEWYKTITSLMTAIHSRIALDLVNDMQLEKCGRRKNDGNDWHHQISGSTDLATEMSKEIDIKAGWCDCICGIPTMWKEMRKSLATQRWQGA